MVDVFPNLTPPHHDTTFEHLTPPDHDINNKYNKTQQFSLFNNHSFTPTFTPPHHDTTFEHLTPPHHDTTTEYCTCLYLALAHPLHMFTRGNFGFRQQMAIERTPCLRILQHLLRIRSRQVPCSKRHPVLILHPQRSRFVPQDVPPFLPDPRGYCCP